MVEYSLDLDIPNEVMENSMIQKLLLYCKDIVAWTNVSDKLAFGTVCNKHEHFFSGSL
jgi:hypothetical protein